MSKVIESFLNSEFAKKVIAEMKEKNLQKEDEKSLKEKKEALEILEKHKKDYELSFDHLLEDLKKMDLGAKDKNDDKDVEEVEGDKDVKDDELEDEVVDLDELEEDEEEEEDEEDDEEEDEEEEEEEEEDEEDEEEKEGDNKLSKKDVKEDKRQNKNVCSKNVELSKKLLKLAIEFEKFGEEELAEKLELFALKLLEK